MDGTLQIWHTAATTDAGPWALCDCGNRVAALWFDPSPTGDFLVAELPPNSAPRIHFLRLRNSPHAETP
jgi:hypothetical protein